MKLFYYEETKAILDGISKFNAAVVVPAVDSCLQMTNFNQDDHKLIIG